MRILHCIVDDKFIDEEINIFEDTKGKHYMEYIFIAENKNNHFTYIKNKELIRVIPMGESVEYINKGDFDLVILHSLNSIPIDYISKIKNNIKILWKAWGFDLYRYPNEIRPFIKLKRLRPRTKKYWNKNYKKQRIINLKVFIYDLIYNKRIKQSVERIDYFSGCLPIEYKLIKDSVPYFKAKHLPFAYFDRKDPFTDEHIDHYPQLDSYILVGNAAGVPNNHLDILAKLKCNTTAERKILLPLNYGGDGKYIDYVINDAKSYWGDNNIVALRDFMPKTEYFKLLEKCGYAIFGHEQQAALSNIYKMLWQGSKVFLSETSVNFKYFKSIGMIVFSIQSDLTSLSINRPLSMEEKKNNREVILKHSSVKDKLNEICNIYTTVEKDKV